MRTGNLSNRIQGKQRFNLSLVVWYLHYYSVFFFPSHVCISFWFTMGRQTNFYWIWLILLKLLAYRASYLVGKKVLPCWGFRFGRCGLLSIIFLIRIELQLVLKLIKKFNIKRLINLKDETMPIVLFAVIEVLFDLAYLFQKVFDWVIQIIDHLRFCDFVLIFSK